MMRVKQLAGAANTGTCGKRGLKEYCLLTMVDVQHHELEVNNQGTREEEHFTLHYDGDNEILARPETAPGRRVRNGRHVREPAGIGSWHQFFVRLQKKTLWSQSRFATFEDF
jgi:hypothetical protein